MTEVECPLCDYRGSVGSVEAHISGNTDGAHLGRSGVEFREELTEDAEAAVGGAVDRAGVSPGLALVVATALLVVSAVVGAGESESISESEPETVEASGGVVSDGA